MTEEEAKLQDELASFRQKFIDAMDDDVNTADAVSAIFELAKFMNSNITENSSKEFAQKALDEDLNTNHKEYRCLLRQPCRLH